MLWTLYDDLTVKGTETKNSDFEAASDWELEGDGSTQVAYCADAGVPHGGKSCVKAWHNGPAIQKMDVKAGAEVKLSFWYKAAAK